MRIKTITTTDRIDKCAQLERSLSYHGYDYHLIEHVWDGFLSKIHQTAKYLRSLEGYTHFLYTDAWDTFALAPEKELYTKMPETGLLFSAERACYPFQELAPMYPENPSPFKYVNGGGWCGEIKAFLAIYDKTPPSTELNDQVWLTNMFLHNQDIIKLDYDCDIFQTLAFCPDTDFTYSDRCLNNITGKLPIFVHGNGHTSIAHLYNMLPVLTDTLENAAKSWFNSKEQQKAVCEAFHDKVNETKKLKELRDYIEANEYGFGERCFYWMWKLIFDTLPKEANVLEIGVYKGQTLALFKMLSKTANIVGVTPLTGMGGFADVDYMELITDLHDKFKLKHPTIIKGKSQDEGVIDVVALGEYDVVYIDGGHDYATAHADVYKYSSFVKVGGYLVVDDCANRYEMPDGYFSGIQEVSDAVDSLLPNEHYIEIMNVGHNRIFKRVK